MSERTNKPYCTVLLYVMQATYVDFFAIANWNKIQIHNVSQLS